MTKVTLHGALGKAVGRSEWMLDVRSPREAMRAIESNSKRLYSYLLTHQQGEAPYQVIADGKVLRSLEKLSAPIHRYQHVEIVPVLAGESSGSGLLIIIGAVLVLIAVTVLTAGLGDGPAVFASNGVYLGGGTATAWFGAATSSIAFSTLMMGASLVVGGLSSMLAPKPKSQADNDSLLFNGAVNTTEQGVPVPVGYGELIVGSATISAGVTTEQIPVGVPPGAFSYVG